MFTKRIVCKYIERKNIAKIYNQRFGLGYRLDHKLFFGPNCIMSCYTED